jgi:4-hydroxy-3-methylbut-2-enyl diphosphate reductase
LPVYFINSADKILSAETVMHYNFHTNTELVTQNFLPARQPLTILITSGASCPDSLVEGVIKKLAGFFPASKNLNEIMEQYQ